MALPYESWINARRVAVMGAGTMGSGIAAHLANLGFEVILFDLTRESVQAAFERAQRIRPPHLFGPEAASRISLASITDDIELIRDADWVCEAVVEKAEVKQELYAAIEPLLRDDAMISTNTSGLEISMLMEGRSESFRKRFIGTHFFNPPRYLKLIELIPTKDTSPDAVAAMTQFLEDKVGRRVVLAKDTPGFIANRYGMWALFQAIHTAEKLNFSVETVDAITGPFIGRPRSATFRLADLIGMDIMADIAGNLVSRCTHDERMPTLALPKTLTDLMEQGRIGSKSGQGYFKKEGDQFLSYDLVSKQYRPRVEPEISGLAEMSRLPIRERLHAALEHQGEAGAYLREHLIPVLQYAAELGSEISYSVKDFDEVMKWGWGWEYGPFELIDIIGSDYIKASDKAPYYQDGKALNLERMQHVAVEKDDRFARVADYPIVSSSDVANIRDDKKGGFIFEFRTKANSISPGLVEALQAHLAEHAAIRLTIANDANNFSVGFDLAHILKCAEEERFEEMRKDLESLQQVGLLLRGIPSAAALRGFSLGGGLELAMHCRTAVANPEAQLGLPEVSVGLIPSGGGCAIMRARAGGDPATLCSIAVNVAAGRKFGAFDGKKQFFLRETDVLEPNPDQLISAAIEADRPIEALQWQPAPPMLAGMIDGELEKLRAAGEIGEYGASLASEIKHIFVRSTDERHARELEIEAFLRVLGKPRSQMRIRHLLEKGKTVNN